MQCPDHTERQEGKGVREHQCLDRDEVAAKPMTNVIGHLECRGGGAVCYFLTSRKFVTLMNNNRFEKLSREQ